MSDKCQRNQQQKLVPEAYPVRVHILIIYTDEMIKTETILWIQMCSLTIGWLCQRKACNYLAIFIVLLKYKQKRLAKLAYELKLIYHYRIFHLINSKYFPICLF